jgi:hypothetical protein
MRGLIWFSSFREDFNMKNLQCTKIPKTIHIKIICHHDIAEILLKVALNTITLPPNNYLSVVFLRMF